MQEDEMNVVYISSPYSVGDQAVNVRRQLEAADEAICAGLCPYAPLLSHFQHMHRPRPYKHWMDISLEMLSRCDAVIRLTGKSKGADQEVKLARKLKIPVFIETPSHPYTSDLAKIRRLPKRGIINNK
jgi:hypothetical protein